MKTSQEKIAVAIFVPFLMVVLSVVWTVSSRAYTEPAEAAPAAPSQPAAPPPAAVQPVAEPVAPLAPAPEEQPKVLVARITCGPEDSAAHIFATRQVEEAYQISLGRVGNLMDLDTLAEAGLIDTIEKNALVRIIDSEPYDVDGDTLRSYRVEILSGPKKGKVGFVEGWDLAHIHEVRP